MYIFHIFRSFLPLHNTIGFGASDFIELSLGLFLVSLALARPWIQSAAQRLTRRPVWCILLTAMLPVVLRVTLLPVSPVPIPSGSDDFSFLLLADTLSHFRLANSTHPLHQFFETIFVLQEPTYGSIYPLGGGLLLACGQLLFALPWAGVVLATGVFCALCFWMLRGWTTPGWALLGGVLAAFQFGPLCYWMNSYWGGALTAAAGCLVFGALPRLRSRLRARDAYLLGLGLALHLLTRPYESIFLLLSVALFFAPCLRDHLLRRSAVKLAGILAATVLPAMILMLFQNKEVTGQWTTLPYMLCRYQYGVPPTFTFQPNAIPHKSLTLEQELDYRANSAIHGNGNETLTTYLSRLYERVRFYRFFLLPPLYLACVAFLFNPRQPHFWWLLATLALFSLGTNFYPFFYPHYIAALACLFVLISVKGLEFLSQWRVGNWASGPALARLLTFLCAVHFLFWYSIHISGSLEIANVMSEYESWDFINSGDPEGRIAINRQLAKLSGKQLVFVRYSPQHMFHEWIHNAAEIDQARVVWARDIGPSENVKLLRYYPNRTPWLLEPDARPPKLLPYQADNLFLKQAQ